MNKVLAIAALCAALVGCVSVKPPADYLDGGYAVIYKSFGQPDDTIKRAEYICKNEAYLVTQHDLAKPLLRMNPNFYPQVFACGREFAIKNDSSAAATRSYLEMEKSSKEEMAKLESMSPEKARIFFTKETHSLVTKCDVFGYVGMTTGPLPSILMAGAVYHGSNGKWDGKTYSFLFNGGSMMASFRPFSKNVKFSLSSSGASYICGESMITDSYK